MSSTGKAHEQERARPPPATIAGSVQAVRRRRVRRGNRVGIEEPVTAGAGRQVVRMGGVVRHLHYSRWLTAVEALAFQSVNTWRNASLALTTWRWASRCSSSPS